MAYRIKPHKSATREILRVACERLEKAQKALLLPPEDRAKGIHQARKRIKEVRALVRLVREPLGEQYQPENRRFRDINRRLSAVRDAGALVESWDVLAGLMPEHFNTEGTQAVRKRLVLRAQDGGQTVGELHGILGEALGDLAAAQEAVSDWPLAGKGFALYRGGLRRSFSGGRKALAAAFELASDERLHDWRKQVKDHWYHTLLLRALWPDAFEVRANMLKQLSELLGQDQDLGMLQRLMEQEPVLFGSENQQEEIRARTGERRAWLQREAFLLGRRLYAEPAAAMAKRWERYWNIARTELR